MCGLPCGRDAWRLPRDIQLSSCRWHEFRDAYNIAGIAIAEALEERRHGALSPRTRQRGGDLICELVRLRQFLIVDVPSFDAIAREHGVAMLRAADVSPATASVLVDEVLDLMHKVTRIALN
jgi:hypothetical protein